MDIFGMLGGLASGAMNFLGQKQTNAMQQQIANQNIALQREFANNGIQMKVNDAKAAGINPLFALGANTQSFSPISVGSSSPLGAASQDIGRAIAATSSADDKAYNQELQQLILKKAGLENELLATQVANSKIATTKAALTPSMPTAAQRWGIDGQGSTAIASSRASSIPGTLVQEKPLEITGRDPSAPYREAGAIPDVGYSRTNTGWAPQFSKDLADRMDENHIGSLMWGWRNYILPNFGLGGQKPGAPLEPGHRWIWDHLNQQWIQTKPYSPRKAYMTGRK